MIREWKKLIIGFDIDGVLNDCHSWIQHDVKNKYGVEFFWDESDLSKLSIPKKVLSFIKSKCFGIPQYMNNLPPTEEAFEDLERLKGVSEVERVIVVTSRSSNPVMVASTRSWVEEHFPGLISEVYFSSYKKGQLLKNLGVDIYIEDILEQAIEVCEHDITCFLLNKTYNHSKDYFSDLLKRRESLKSCIDDIVITCAFNREMKKLLRNLSSRSNKK